MLYAEQLRDGSRDDRHGWCTPGFRDYYYLVTSRSVPLTRSTISYIFTPAGVSRALTLNTIVVGTCLGGLAACPRPRPTCMLKPDSITLIDSAFVLGDAGASISLSQTPTDRHLCL